MKHFALQPCYSKKQVCEDSMRGWGNGQRWAAHLCDTAYEAKEREWFIDTRAFHTTSKRLTTEKIVWMSCWGRWGGGRERERQSLVWTIEILDEEVDEGCKVVDAASHKHHYQSDEWIAPIVPVDARHTSHTNKLNVFPRMPSAHFPGNLKKVHIIQVFALPKKKKKKCDKIFK